MSKSKYKHTPFDDEASAAMINYNSTVTNASEQFTLLDAYILSIIHSYYYNNKSFFGSNEYLATKCFASCRSIQRSINKLCSYGFIKKQTEIKDNRKTRTLIYNPEAVEIFKSKYQTANSI